MPLHTLSSDFSLLSIAAVGSYFHNSLDSLQWTGSEPDGHRTSTFEPPPRQHLSKFPSSSGVCVCVCSARWQHVTIRALLQAHTWGCHPSLSVQTHFICEHVGRCCMCKSRCSCAASGPLVGNFFGGCTGASSACGMQDATACAPLRASCVSRS